MQLAKVTGTLVATRKDPQREGMTFLVLQQVAADSGEMGGFVVAVDAVGAGVGEMVMFASGSSARQTLLTMDKPCDAVVMAIVDTWEVDDEVRYTK